MVIKVIYSYKNLNPLKFHQAITKLIQGIFKGNIFGISFFFLRLHLIYFRECRRPAPLDPLDIYGYAKIHKTPVNQIAGYTSGYIF